MSSSVAATVPSVPVNTQGTSKKWWSEATVEKAKSLTNSSSITRLYHRAYDEIFNPLTGKEEEVSSEDFDLLMRVVTETLTNPNISPTLCFEVFADAFNDLTSLRRSGIRVASDDLKVLVASNPSLPSQLAAFYCHSLNARDILDRASHTVLTTLYRNTNTNADGYDFIHDQIVTLRFAALLFSVTNEGEEDLLEASLRDLFNSLPLHIVMDLVKTSSEHKAASLNYGMAIFKDSLSALTRRETECREYLASNASAEDRYLYLTELPIEFIHELIGLPVTPSEWADAYSHQQDLGLIF
jgi:hypothetical protein